MSGLLSPMTIIAQNGGKPMMRLGHAKWGGIAYKLDRVPDGPEGDESWVLRRVRPTMTWVHITKPEEWKAVANNFDIIESKTLDSKGFK